MSVNRDRFSDENGEFHNWIEIHNPSDNIISLKGFGLSNNVDEPRKWTFNGGEIDPKGYLYVFASGNDRRDQLVRYWETIIDWGDIWNYRLGTSEPPGEWNTLGFDDSGWESGPSGFGFGDSDDSTNVTPVNSLYIRKTFNINPDNIVTAVLHADYDDGFVAYINGIEITRDNLGNPGERPAYSKWASNDHEAEIYRGGSPKVFQIKDFNKLVKSGTNVLTIQVHNYHLLLTFADMTIIPFLTLGLNQLPPEPRGTPELLQNFPTHYHTNFKIGQYGDTLLLTSPAGQIIDKLSYWNIPFNSTLGYLGENRNDLYYLDESTPGIRNSITGSRPHFVSSSDLPLIFIDTKGKHIPDNQKINVEMGAINNPDTGRNNITDLFNNYDGIIGIETRGSTSQSYPKKQYSFETRDSTGANNNVSLLGLPKENDWILYGPYDDKSLIRNAFEYKLANDLGWYASRTRYCELVLNGDYQGIYVLMEKIKRDKNRVDISELNPEDISGEALTGGYIIKIDKTTGEDIGGWYSSFPPYFYQKDRIFFQYHDPKASEIVSEQKEYIQSYMKNMESALWFADLSDSSIHYSEYINTESFVDYFILTEIGKNVDGYRLSTFMYKDRDSKHGKLTMGPVWDYNFAFGRVSYDNAQYTWGWQVDWPGVKYRNIPFWWDYLLSDEDFSNRIVSRWQDLREDVFSNDRLMHIMDSLVLHIDEAEGRNFKRWHVPEDSIKYPDEVKFLRDWLRERLIWMDNNIHNITGIRISNEPDFIPGEFELFQNFPNPFNPKTVISWRLTDGSDVELSIYNIAGRKVATLLSEVQPAGIHQLKWDASDYASGVYFYRLSAKSKSQNFVKTRKLVLLK